MKRARDINGEWLGRWWRHLFVTRSFMAVREKSKEEVGDGFSSLVDGREESRDSINLTKVIDLTRVKEILWNSES